MIAPFMEQIGEDAEPSEVYMKWMEVAEEILSKNRKQIMRFAFLVI